MDGVADLGDDLTLGIALGPFSVFIPPAIRGDDAAMEMYRYYIVPPPSLDTHACVALSNTALQHPRIMTL